MSTFEFNFNKETNILLIERDGKLITTIRGFIPTEEMISVSKTTKRNYVESLYPYINDSIPFESYKAFTDSLNELNE